MNTGQSKVFIKNNPLKQYGLMVNVVKNGDGTFTIGDTTLLK
jgi:hypothetical protein